MKTKLMIPAVAVIVVLLMFIICGTAYHPFDERAAASVTEQQVNEEPRLVTVSGSADILVVPDEVSITLGVETINEDVNEAKRENDERVAKILELTKKYGIASRDVQTNYVNIEPRCKKGYYDCDWSYSKNEFAEFVVTRDIVINLKDVTKFEGLLTAVIAQGEANHVGRISFHTTDLRKYKDQARELAARAAKEKATAIAGELGASIGKPYTIQENVDDWSCWYSYMWWEAYSGGMSTANVIQESGNNNLELTGTMAPGQITVNAKITVVFELN